MSMYWTLQTQEVTSRDKALWSLWDMLQIHAHDLIDTGRRLNSFSTILYQASTASDMPLTKDEKMGMTADLSGLSRLCDRLELPVAKATVERALNHLPETHREWDCVINVVTDELKSRLFMFVPSHRARYHETVYKLASQTLTAFPIASKEVVRAANCYSVGEVHRLCIPRNASR